MIINNKAIEIIILINNKNIKNKRVMRDILSDSRIQKDLHIHNFFTNKKV